LTNGEWLRGAELINRKLHTAGYIALISATDGPVNLYPVKLERHATRELRALMSADGATCAWAGCNQPADFSEAHHIQEWSKGGTTEIENLCWLCTYHNRQNGRPDRGRMQRIGGQIMWQSPKGYLTPRGIKHTDPARRHARAANVPATGPP
ncbi:HNH endonuclease, partial [Corynebacterium sp. HMSC074A01]|uniref:HNH endonuclease n=1 Tax=Corynebacterium sp. HMSC074A01 TaxID=1715030 RepID=UPI00114CE63C